MNIIERVAIRSAGRGIMQLTLGFFLGLAVTAAIIGFFYWLGTL